MELSPSRGRVEYFPKLKKLVTSFYLPVGECFVVVAVLDSMIAFSSLWEKLALYPSQNPETPEVALRWTKIIIICFQFLCNILFWIGGLVMGKIQFTSGWIYVGLTLEFFSQATSWAFGYFVCNERPVPVNSILRLTYRSIVRLLVRIWLVSSICVFMKKSGALLTRKTIREENEQPPNEGTSTATNSITSNFPVPSTWPLPIPITISPFLSRDNLDLLPVGSGLQNLIKFYIRDLHRMARLLLTVDVIWCVWYVIEREVTFVSFGPSPCRLVRPPLPSSVMSNPIFVEDRIVRTFRVVLDIIFLSRLQRQQSPLRSCYIVPKIIEILVSVGILVFLRTVEINDFASRPFTRFYVTFIFDVIFRTVTFLVCYKAHGNFLCRQRKNAVTAIANFNINCGN